jgi:hypothetical protein
MKCQKHGSLLVDKPFDDCHICLREENAMLREALKKPPEFVFESLTENQPPDYQIVNLETADERQARIVKWLRMEHYEAAARRLECVEFK